jgi:hypothetical protein
MDVKFKGENVDRHLDITTSNHASTPGGPPANELEKQQIPRRVSDKEEKCPVCDKGPNPTPGKTPEYVNPPRVPKDNETLIGREGLQAKGSGKRVKGAKCIDAATRLYTEIPCTRARRRRSRCTIVQAIPIWARCVPTVGQYRTRRSRAERAIRKHEVH